MLNWMGGSRRKFSNSAKSVEKRQRQYFEQRRRQQQQLDKLEAEAESFRCVINLREKNHQAHHSLDVICLKNLAKDCRPSKSANASSSDDALKEESYRPVINLPEKNHPEHHSLDTTCINNSLATDCPPSKPVNASSSHNHHGHNAGLSKVNNTSPMTFPTNLVEVLEEPSMFAGLEDDAELSSSPVHEAHAAFSVDELSMFDWLDDDVELSTRNPVDEADVAFSVDVSPTKTKEDVVDENENESSPFWSSMDNESANLGFTGFEGAPPVSRNKRKIITKMDEYDISATDASPSYWSERWLEGSDPIDGGDRHKKKWGYSEKIYTARRSTSGPFDPDVGYKLEEENAFDGLDTMYGAGSNRRKKTDFSFCRVQGETNIDWYT